jgi:hypothetical protein
MTSAIASSMAVSEPGRMNTCSSAICALVRVTRGSTQIMRTPRSLAQRRYCMEPVPKWPSPGLQPQSSMSREFA